MTFKPKTLAFTLALLFATTLCIADDAVIGYVKTALGDASVIRNSQTLQAEPGTPVKAADLLKTGKQASMGIALKDNTLLSIGPDTELVVEAYLYNPAHDGLTLGMRLSQGTLNYVSGMIAKLKPAAVSVRTPTGNIGVRGTHFVAKVNPE